MGYRLCIKGHLGFVQCYGSIVRHPCSLQIIAATRAVSRRPGCERAAATAVHRRRDCAAADGGEDQRGHIEYMGDGVCERHIVEWEVTDT